MIKFLKKNIFLVSVVFIGVIIIFLVSFKNQHADFYEKEIMALINQQLNYGSRYMGSEAHEKEIIFLITEMQNQNANVSLQTFDYSATDGKIYKIKNIIARFFPEKKQRIILGTHYDSKRFADQDLSYKDQPVPGANDSASGTAILIQLAHLLSSSKIKPNIGIDFVFFDGEEGDINQKNNYTNWKPLGSTYFAENLNEFYKNTKPESALILDMVCSGNPEKREDILDDQTPLNKAGIPSALIIGFDYPPWHTTGDTLDKCNANTLKTVAKATFDYVYSIK
jgi:glutaminyl-peptide cyclotransferase